MKKRYQKGLAIVAILFITISIVGCKSKKKTITKKLEDRGEVEIVEHCSGKSYFSTNKYFRANATGESIDRETAKKKARSNAMGELAKSIKATMKIVGDNYANSTEFNNKEEITETFNELTRMIVNEEISGAVKICDKLTQKNDDNTYVSYVALELSALKIASKYYKSLSKNEKIKANYNYEKFKETFEKEMNKLDNR